MKKQRGDKKLNKDRRDKKKTLFEDINNIIKEQELQQKSKTKNKKKRVSTSIASDDDNDKKKQRKGPKHEESNRNDHSESSTSSESNEEDEGEDVESNEESDNENKEIEEEVEKNESENSDSESSSTKKNSKKNNGKHSIVTPNMKSLLQWWVRNPLFKRVKVLDESHLDAKGNIMQEALERLKIDKKTSKNVSAFIVEFRQIIKRSITSRRGYVKRKIGHKLTSLLKSNQLSFEMLASINNFYKEDFEQDKNVRTLWYFFCYHFLPVINRDWKSCLHGSRVLKTTFLYEQISTSDEAMVLWMIKSWEPKLKDQAEKGWPGFANTPADGEQELRAGLKEYIGYHNLIAAFKNKEGGELACKWNDIFWEEMVANNQNMFKKQNFEVSNQLLATDQQEIEDAVVLPGIDEDNNDLIGCFSKRKALKKNIASSNTLTIDKEDDTRFANQDFGSGNSSESIANQNGQNHSDKDDAPVNPNSHNLPGIFLDEIKNKAQI